MIIIDKRRLKPPDQLSPRVRALLAPILAPASLLYGLGMEVWRRLPCKATDLGRPVVSVGSIMVGGTGTTPLCIRIASELSRQGRRVCILSRGYMRKAKRSPLVVSDGRGALATVAEAGDEPYLMARRLPKVCVVVDKDRLRAARHAMSVLGPDVFVLDDGLQTRTVVKTIELVCVDVAGLASRQYLLPLGRLRERWSHVGADTVIVVLMESGDSGPGWVIPKGRSRSTIFGAVRESTGVMNSAGAPMEARDCSGLRVLALSGIGRPHQFEAACVRAGLNVAAALRMDDHHWYHRRDAQAIRSLMERHRCASIVTTEKDLNRLPEELRPMTLVLQSDLTLLDAEGFWAMINARLSGGEVGGV
jgi:tetraacyldisaccharide 4'-kinase